MFVLLPPQDTKLTAREKYLLKQIMDYSIFCCYEDHVTSLTKQEIENPFIVLDELCKKRSLKDFQNDLKDFLWIVAKDDEWFNFNTSHLYQTYKDLIRLIDVLWLINKYYSQPSTVTKSKQAHTQNGTKCELTRDFKRLFYGSQGKNNYSDPKENLTGKSSAISNLYKEHHFECIKSDLFKYLQIGFNASFMKNDKYDFFGVSDNDIIAQFSALNSLMEGGYKINQKEFSAFPEFKSCPDIMFATDLNHPTELGLEDLLDPSSIAYVIYNYYINIDYVHQSIEIWKKMLYEQNFWQKTDNPGNLFYLCECLKMLTDGIWLQIQLRVIKTRPKRRKVTKKCKQIAITLNKLEQRNPSLAIKNFFKHKEMHEWKKQFEKWAEYGVSNTNTFKIEDKNKTAADFVHLLKFIEATYILYYSKHQIT